MEYKTITFQIDIEKEHLEKLHDTYESRTSAEYRRHVDFDNWLRDMVNFRMDHHIDKNISICKDHSLYFSADPFMK